MTAEEFRKYEGCRTTGEIDGCKLAGGRIIGYGTEDDGIDLLAINDERGWGSPSMNDVVIPNDKDRKDYFDGKHKYLWVGKNNVFIEKELDLTEILKGCEGVELWSDIFGECKLISADNTNPYEILVSVSHRDGNCLECQTFTKYGRFYDCYPNGKCILWPSEKNRDWSTFKKPVKVLDDDWFACTDGNGVYTVIKYGNISESWKYIIPYDKFIPDLTKEELKKLSIV